MFSRSKTNDAHAKLDALDQSQAIIEFDLTGKIQNANRNFLDAVGYTFDEIRGRHHSMFVEPSFKESEEYRVFWERLGRGEHQVAQYKRIAKGGKEIWLEASYNPVRGKDGKPAKIVKFATDVSRQKTEYADLIGQVNAINKAQAVIQFDLDGNILTANENFLNAVGYTLDEIKGRHHSMFVDDGQKSSAEYRAFWAALRRGEHQAAQYRRLGKGGREVWIEASYNPILDLNGRPCKVVKFATDITAQIKLLGELKRLIDENFSEIDVALGHSVGHASSAVSAVVQTSDSMQLAAASAEELAASISEISDAMVRSRTAADAAHQETRIADEATQRLTGTAKAMGSIVALIQNIASQINLLALNATIESARAGEAGRGFAVVASEIKNLARQASDATDQISAEIDGMQTVSDDVVKALGVIGTSIGTMRDYVAGSAAAVEEQSTVTQGVSRNMQAAVVSMASIKASSEDISAAISQVATVVGTTKEAARVLAR